MSSPQPTAAEVEAAKQWATEEAEHLDELATAEGLNEHRARFYREEAQKYRTLLAALSRSVSDGEDGKDAARYRFLRDNDLGFRAVDGNASVPPHPDVMDRWVDAARTPTRGGDQG